MSEIWKDIKGFDDYMISNMGFVISKERYVLRKLSNGTIHKKKVNTRVLKPALSGGGYEFVCLRKNGRHYNKRIHRLVAEHFLHDFKEGLVVHHKNSIKTDNRVINLEWTSKQNNTQLYYKTNGKSVGEVPLLDVPKIINRIKNGEQCYKIAEEYNVTRNDISVLCKIISLTNEELEIKEP
jgi:hypothetical protein